MNLYKISQQINSLNKYINLNIDICKYKNIPFLVDTGADICIIKKSILYEDTIIFTDAKCKLKGISSEMIETVAECDGLIQFSNGTELGITLQIVEDSFPITAFGIIGQNFLSKNQCNINFQNLIVEIPIDSDVLSLKLHSDIQVETLKPIELSPRSEKIITIPVNLLNEYEFICPSQEVAPSIFIANSIHKVQGNYVTLPVLNISDQYHTIPKLTFKIEPFNNYEIFSLEKCNEDISERLSIFEQSITYDHLNKEEIDSLKPILTDFNDVFYLPGDKLTTTDVIQHRVKTLPESSPISVRPFRQPHSTKSEIQRQVNNMLEDGIVQDSMSPWNFPLLLVPKRSSNDEKKWRVVVDYRKLNQITIDDTFPLPNITDILDKLGMAQYFSTLDLQSGYHQIKLEPSDRPKTAFNTDEGHYEFVSMPFGLKGAPATFQRMINCVLSGLNNIKCLAYLDDVVVFGETLVDHNNRLKEVLQRFRRYNLKVNPSKCQFLRKEIYYLGHVVTPNGIKPDETKIIAVKQFPVPKNRTEIKSFLGLAGYYRKFIPYFSGVARPLTNLLKKNTTFKWSSECQKAFESLKESLINPPILQMPNFTKPFKLTCDASDHALGAILSQDVEGFDLPIAYASRVLSNAEINYSPTDKELSAIIWGMSHFRPYLYGHKFCVVTDHRALLWLYKLESPKSRQIRWQIYLGDYDFTIIHKPGTLIKNADALSRIRQETDKSLNVFECNAITRSKTHSNIELQKVNSNLQINDNDTNTSNPKIEENELEQSIESHTTSHDTLNDKPSLFEYNIDNNSDNRKDLIIKHITDESEIQQLIHDFHISPLGGHQGIYRTFKRIRQYYNFPNIYSTIKQFISKCKLCQINKHGRNTKEPMKITSTSSKSFEKVFLDIVGPLPSSHKNNKYILTIQDDLTKYSIAHPIPSQETEIVARVFVEKFICIYGIPDQILTDQGTNFMSTLFTQICKLLKIKKLSTTAYHPQSNGALERFHKTLGEYLRNFSQSDSLNWDMWLPYLTFCYNTTPHSSTDYMPYELVFGFAPNIPTSISKEPEPIYTIDDYYHDLKYRLQNSFTIAKNNLLKIKEKTKSYYDKSINPQEFQTGDLVLLQNEKNKKLDPEWLGPYEIDKIISLENSSIKIGRTSKIVHNNRLKIFKS